MSDELFDIVFFGILQPGKDRNMVMQNMAMLFKTDVKKLAPYFVGGRKVIKGKVNAGTAEKYQAALENVGLVIKVEPCQQAPDNSTANQTQVSQPAAIPAQNTTQPESTRADTGGITIAPVGTDVIDNPVKVAAQKIDDISFITMAEPGADIIAPPAAVAAQKIADISDITIAEAGSNVLEHPVKVAAQEIGDISDISLAEAGADIIANPKPVEKADIPDFNTLSLCSD
jgi:hypothetical protein